VNQVNPSLEIIKQSFAKTQIHAELNISLGHFFP